MNGYTLGSLLGYIFIVLVGAYIISVVFRWNKHTNKKNASKKEQNAKGNVAIKETKHGFRLVFSAILILIGGLIIISSIFGAIIQFTSYGGNSETENLESQSTAMTTWSASAKTTHIKDCIDGISKENITQQWGYSDVQIQSYCSCITSEVVAQYPNPQIYYNLPKDSQFFTDTGNSCASRI